MAPTSTTSTPRNQTYGRSRHWSARINLAYSHRFDRTALTDVEFEGPLRVQRPFYPEGGVCHTYLLHPPGGMVSGDELAIQLKLSPDTHVVATTPSAGKIYCADSESVTQQQRIIANVQRASLEWLPQETIIFDGAQANLSTKFELNNDSQLIAWEMVGLGRQAGQQPFQNGSLTQNISIEVDGRPLLVESFVLDESLRLLDASLGLMGRPYFGTMYFAKPGADDLIDSLKEALTAASKPDVLAAITSKPNLAMVRALAYDAEALRLQFIDIWSRCRPLFLGRQACPPRIWFT